MQQEINSLSLEIDELTELLRDTHLREGVLKARLNRAVEKKYRLIKECRRDRNSRNEHPRTSTPVAVGAVVVENIKESGSGIGTSIPRSKQSPVENRRTHQTTHSDSSSHRGGQTSEVCDRYGVVINIGDEVLFLTKGTNTSKTGEVHKFTRKYVVCVDSNDVLTKRYPRNLRVTSKFHEC